VADFTAPGEWPIGASLFGWLLSLFRGVWLTLSSLALFLTSSGAQEDLDRGKIWTEVRLPPNFTHQCKTSQIPRLPFTPRGFRLPRSLLKFYALAT
jgi:hypothetical protein